MKDKNLNLIFFVDANKTRRFQLPLEKVVILLGITLATILWALSSVFLIYSLSNANDTQYERIAELQKAIFNFQTRYENIYEKAYKISNEVNISKNEKENIDVIPQMQEKVDDKVASKKKRDEVSRLSTRELNVKEIAEVSTKEKVSSEDELKQVSIQSIKIVNDNKLNKMTVWYSIKNSNPSKRAVGYVVGKAYFVDANGKETIIQSPENWINTKDFASFTRKHKYKIKRFKRTNMNFVLPENFTSKLVKVELVVISKNNIRKVITKEVGEKKNK